MKRKHSKRIIIVVTYYGTFPWYFDYFLHSCKFNTKIDFLIVTDNPAPSGLPGNVKWLKMDLADLTTLATRKIGVPVRINFPYKLCDFKPAYGLIFADYLEDYEFWGQSDIDVILGDISAFFTDELLTEYDYISVRHDFTTGCLSLFRNSEPVNSIFKQSKDYELVFSSDKHYCFDECNFVHEYLTEGGSIFDVETEVESYTHVIQKSHNQGLIKAHFDFILIEGVIGNIRFDSGKVSYKNTFEAVAYHLLQLKRVFQPARAPRVIPDSYRISPTRIY